MQEKNPEVLVVKPLLILTRKSKKKIKLQEQQLELRKKRIRTARKTSENYPRSAKSPFN